MAYQTVSPKPYKTYNGVAYDLQYDTSNGKVQLIQQNAPTGTQPIFSDGKWNSQLATTAGISSGDQKTTYNSIQQVIYDSFKNAGGTANNLTLPPWAKNGNDGSSPGQTTTPVPSQPSPTTSGNPSNPIEGFTQLLGALVNPNESFKEISITNGGYGSADQALGGTHKYPIDMQTKYQDYMHITMYQYQPPQAKSLLSGDINSLINQGFQKDLNFQKSKTIGHVILPMPNGFNDQLTATWQGDTMNNLSAAALADAMNNVKDYGMAALTGAGINKGLNVATGGAVGGGMGQGAQFAIKALQAGKYGAALSQGGTAESRSSVGAAVLEQILAQGFFAAEADSIIARTAGVVANNNLELMFQGPTLRTFTFSYKLTARDEGEAKVIRKILRFFKQGSRPKKKNGGVGASSYFLATPNVFKIKFCLGGGSENKAVSRIKTCACSGVTVNYNGAGPIWAAYEDGQPIAVDLTLEFSELEPIFDTDYQEDVFNDFVGAIDGVSNDAVGY